MSTSPATASSAVVNKAAAKAGVAAAAVSEAMPVVVETADLALTVPAKVVLNQRLIVATALVGGAALGAGVFYGVNKFMNRNKVTLELPNQEKVGENSKVDPVV